MPVPDHCVASDRGWSLISGQVSKLHLTAVVSLETQAALALVSFVFYTPAIHAVLFMCQSEPVLSACSGGVATCPALARRVLLIVRPAVMALIRLKVTQGNFASMGHLVNIVQPTLILVKYLCTESLRFRVL